MPNDILSLEGFFTKMEGETDSLLRLSEDMTKSVKLLRNLAREGNLRDLGKSLEALKRTFVALTQEVERSQNSWTFDHEKYFSSRQFHDELRTLAQSMGLTIHERDCKLYCYPHIITVIPKDAVVRIDRKAEKRVRPSHLVKHLKELNKRPIRSKPDDFLESLFTAYLRVVSLKEEQLTTPGPVVPLITIYDLFTLLPGLSSEYTLQEFASDIYGLDHNRLNKTRNGVLLDFPASTALRSTRGVINAITPDGEEKRYYGLRFIPKEREGANL